MTVDLLHFGPKFIITVQTKPLSAEISVSLFHILNSFIIHDKIMSFTMFQLLSIKQASSESTLVSQKYENSDYVVH